MISFFPSGALAQAITGTETGSNLKQNIPLCNVMDSTYGVGNSTVSVALSRDRVEGSYSVEVYAGDIANQNYASYKLVDSDVFNISTHSRIKVWIKPGRGAKWIKFRTGNSYITSDKNADGLFRVGEDIKSGKWNLITLDLTKANPNLTRGDDLSVTTNEYSTWYYDNIASVYAPTSSVDIAKMVNSQTQLVNGNTELHYRKPITISNSNGAELTNFQVQLTINTQELISAGNMRSDGGDIRFKEADGTAIPCWVESGINTTTTKIWVKIASIPNGGKTIYLHYGDSSLTSQSSWDNTFAPVGTYASEIVADANVVGLWRMNNN